MTEICSASAMVRGIANRRVHTYLVLPPTCFISRFVPQRPILKRCQADRARTREHRSARFEEPCPRVDKGLAHPFVDEQDAQTFRYDRINLRDTTQMFRCHVLDLCFRRAGPRWGGTRARNRKRLRVSREGGKRAAGHQQAASIWAYGAPTPREHRKRNVSAHNARLGPSCPARRSLGSRCRGSFPSSQGSPRCPAPRPTRCCRQTPLRVAQARWLRR